MRLLTRRRTHITCQITNIIRCRHASTQLKPQLNYTSLTSQQQIQDIKHNLQARRINKSIVDIDEIVDLYAVIRRKEEEALIYRKQFNQAKAAVLQAITRAKKQSNKQSTDSQSHNDESPNNQSQITNQSETLDPEQAKLHAQQAKEKVEHFDKELRELKQQLENEYVKIPNSIHPNSPVGEEEKMELVGFINEKPVFDFPPQDHLDICVKHNLLEMEQAAQMTGSRFSVMKHELAVLELALIHWSMSELVKRGFQPVSVPELIQQPFIHACGFQPRDVAETQVYDIDQSNLSLIGTAELPLVSLYSNQTLLSQQLPLKLCAFSHSFRTEAGGHGKQTRGLYRLHQFSKVEMVSICSAEQSDESFEEIVSIQHWLYSQLGLHARVMNIASADLGASAYRKTDCEAWMPGRNEGVYGEISSSSQCLDYQARRLNIKHRPHSNQSPQFVHTNNGTAIAVPRMIIAILEQRQRWDGSVDIPEVLHPFMMGIKTIPSFKGNRKVLY